MNGCVHWTGYIDPKGYGHKGVGLAHRWVYEQAHGPIPQGLEIDHLCRNRSCVELSHLEAVTHRENLLRGDTLAAREARRTVCANGHPYDAMNTHVDKQGKRHCRTCDRERHREYARR